jgi:hypothetical protein
MGNISGRGKGRMSTTRAIERNRLKKMMQEQGHRKINRNFNFAAFWEIYQSDKKDKTGKTLKQFVTDYFMYRRGRKKRKVKK